MELSLFEIKKKKMLRQRNVRLHVAVTLAFALVRSATLVISFPPSTIHFDFEPCRRLTELNADRRALLSSAVALPSVLLLQQTVYADTELKIDIPKKPFAPTEKLLPAARVKLSIDRAVTIASRLIDDPSNSAAVLELETSILEPQNYVGSLKLQGVPQKPAKQYLDSYKSMSGDLPFQQYLIKNGDVSTWRDLKRKEKEREQTNEIRAALNAYTDALSFSPDSYLLNVDRATRSSMVREDRLPEVKQVITSDMGMRYLYRNQVLTAMDDVRAELEYQLSKEGQIDARELLELLKEAQKACERWFSLIDPNDVREAIETAAIET